MIDLVQEQINKFISITKKELESKLSNDRENIVIVSYYPTYRSQYGELIERLMERYNVIVVYSMKCNDEFEKKGHHSMFIPWRIVENNQTYYLNMDIPNIDLIITADEVGYLEGKIDKTFLSKTAKRIYLPHRLNGACGNLEYHTGVLVPSKRALEGFKEKDSNKLIKCGYPQLDYAIKNYTFKDTNTICYAPTLRYVEYDRKANVNIFGGLEILIIEWLLKNTTFNIVYRAHPLAFSNNHSYYKTILSRFRDEKRFSFNNSIGYDFFNNISFMITDWSSTSRLFSYTTLRPCLFFMPYPMNDSELANGEYVFSDLRASSLESLKKLMDNIDYKKEEARYKQMREDEVYNIGKSCEAILDYIGDILGG